MVGEGDLAGYGLKRLTPVRVRYIVCILSEHATYHLMRRHFRSVRLYCFLYNSTHSKPSDLALMVFSPPDGGCFVQCGISPHCLSSAQISIIQDTHFLDHCSSILTVTVTMYDRSSLTRRYIMPILSFRHSNGGGGGGGYLGR